MIVGKKRVINHMRKSTNLKCAFFFGRFSQLHFFSLQLRQLFQLCITLHFFVGSSRNPRQKDGAGITLSYSTPLPRPGWVWNGRRMARLALTRNGNSALTLAPSKERALEYPQERNLQYVTSCEAEKLKSPLWKRGLTITKILEFHAVPHLIQIFPGDQVKFVLYPAVLSPQFHILGRFIALGSTALPVCHKFILLLGCWHLTWQYLEMML